MGLMMTLDKALQAVLVVLILQQIIQITHTQPSLRLVGIRGKVDL